MNEDDVYNNDMGIWCRILYIKPETIYGVSLNVLDGSYWPWGIDKEVFDFELCGDIPEDVRDKLFDPFIEIEFRKQLIRQGIVL